MGTGSHAHVTCLPLQAGVATTASTLVALDYQLVYVRTHIPEISHTGALEQRAVDVECTTT